METILGIPTKAWGPFVLWILVAIIQVPWILYCLVKIEKSGVARWGATKRLFKYQ